jgi:type III secretion protein J
MFLARPTSPRLGAVVVAALALGCTVPVATGVDEQEANGIVVALDRAAIDGTKEPDPQAEGKFRVVVARDDVAAALGTLRAEELPRPKPPGLLDTLDKGALVPSASAEHAQLVAGMAGELERSLLGLDGVLAARVHLAVPPPEPLRDGPRPKTTASVLLEHRGSTPPVTAEAVQRLVAGGAPQLAPEDVTVILVPRPAPPAAREAQLAHVGPIAVARGSAQALKLALGGLVALVALLATATLFLFSRLARARAELEQKSG